MHRGDRYTLGEEAPCTARDLCGKKRLKEWADGAGRIESCGEKSDGQIVLAKASVSAFMQAQSVVAGAACDFGVTGSTDVDRLVAKARGRA